MPLKILLTIFIVVVLLRTWARRQRGGLSSREATAWTVLWLLVLAAVLNPHATDVVARWFGVGRGADLLILFSIVALFALVSWLLSRVAKIERDITTIVRETALRNVGESRNSEYRIQNTESDRPLRHSNM